jgi:hypothetical protein
MKINVSDRKTQLIVGGVVLGLGVLIYFLFKNKPLGVEVMQFDENSIDSQGQIPENNLDVDLVLKQGSISLIGNGHQAAFSLKIPIFLLGISIFN